MGRLLGTAAMGLLIAIGGHAETATDLNCVQCVDGREIENHSIPAWKLRDRSVGFNKLRGDVRDRMFGTEQRVVEVDQDLADTERNVRNLDSQLRSLRNNVWGHLTPLEERVAEIDELTPWQVWGYGADGNPMVLGYFVGFEENGYAEVIVEGLIEQEWQRQLVRVAGDRLLGYHQLYHAGPNCSGDVYLALQDHAGPRPLIARAHVTNDRIYTDDFLGASVQQATYQSTRLVDGSCVEQVGNQQLSVSVVELRQAESWQAGLGDISQARPPYSLEFPGRFDAFCPESDPNCPRDRL